MHFVKKMVMSVLLSLSFDAYAQSVQGYVQEIQVEPTGKLWFLLDVDRQVISPYCGISWKSFSMYIAKDSPEYPYYFAMLMTAYTKRKKVFLENISNAGTNKGQAPCDISKSGYGIVLVQ